MTVYSSVYVRDFMEGTMANTTKMLAFLHPIIEEADPELEDFLIRYVLIIFMTVKVQLARGMEE